MPHLNLMLRLDDMREDAGVVVLGGRASRSLLLVLAGGRFPRLCRTRPQLHLRQVAVVLLQDIGSLEQLGKGLLVEYWLTFRLGCGLVSHRWKPLSCLRSPAQERRFLPF
jgi:hypothetical protein